MAEGMPKPKSTIETIKSRRKTIDDAEMAATGSEEVVDNTPTYDTPKPKKIEPKGMPKPGVFTRIKKFVMGE